MLKFLILGLALSPILVSGHRISMQNYQTKAEDDDSTPDGYDEPKVPQPTPPVPDYTEEEMSQCVEKIRNDKKEEDEAEEYCQPYLAVISNVLELLRVKNETCKSQYADLMSEVEDHNIFRDCFEKVLVLLAKGSDSASLNQLEGSDRSPRFFIDFKWKLEGLFNKGGKTSDRDYYDNDYYRRCYRRSRYDDDDYYWNDDYYYRGNSRRCCGRYRLCEFCEGGYTTSCCRYYCDWSDWDTDFNRYGCSYDNDSKYGNSYCRRNKSLDFCRKCRHCRCHEYYKK